MKNCLSYLGYSITSDGQVFSHRRRFGKGKGNGGGVIIDNAYCRTMNPYVGHGGYLYVSVSTKRGQRSVAIHTLLLDAFIGKRPKNKETRHLDGNPLNNNLTNICYGSRKENAADKVKHGRSHNKEIFNKQQILQIRDFHKNETIASIARRFAVSESCIRDIVKRKTYARYLT